MRPLSPRIEALIGPAHTDEVVKADKAPDLCWILIDTDSST